MKRYVILRFFMALLLSSISVTYAGEHHAHTSSYQQTPLTDNTVLLRGKGGNILLLKGDDGLLLVDTDYQELSPALKGVLAEYGGLNNVTYIINTHWHGDHTQGNMMLGHHAPIIAHDNVRSRLLTQQEIKMFNMVSEPYPAHAIPTITYDNAITLRLNDETVSINHYPRGHTDGDSIIFLQEANIVHMGDHFFSGMFPFVDVANGGNVVQMTDNIASVLDLIDDETVVIPGHGVVTDKTGLTDFHAMLLGTTAEVKDMIEQGLSLAEMQEEGLSLDWEDWANGMLSSSQWIALIAVSLEQ